MLLGITELCLEISITDIVPTAQLEFYVLLKELQKLALIDQSKLDFAFVFLE